MWHIGAQKNKFTRLIWTYKVPYELCSRTLFNVVQLMLGVYMPRGRKVFLVVDKSIDGPLFVLMYRFEYRFHVQDSFISNHNGINILLFLEEIGYFVKSLMIPSTHSITSTSASNVSMASTSKSGAIAFPLQSSNVLKTFFPAPQ